MKTGVFSHRVVGMAAMALFAVLAVQAQAADFKPTKPITMVIPGAPGGGSDILGRSIARIVETEKLSPQPLVVVNWPGGSTTIAQTRVFQAKGDTHMLYTFGDGQVTAPTVVGQGTPTYRDLTMIANFAVDEQFIVVKTDSRFKSIKDVVAESKKSENSVTISGTGKGTQDHMCTSLFEKAAGIKLRYVSYNSGGEQVISLLGGHVDLAWLNPAEFVPQYEAGMVRLLAIAKDTRVEMFKNVPTFKENGLNVTFQPFRGIAGPPGLSPEVVDYYESMLRKVSTSKAWKEQYMDKYMLSPGWMGSKEFTKFVADSEGVFGNILKDLGLIK